MIEITEVILIRHGETYWNFDGKYQGHSNVGLTALGREQANHLRRRFRHYHLGAIYASDLSRAKETAEIVAKPHNLTVTTARELREINFGEWEGLTYKEIINQYAETANKWYQTPSTVVIPGGESFIDLKNRAYEAVKSLVKKHPEESIIIVTHGGTIRAIICAVLDLHLDKIWRLRQDNTAVNILEFYDQRVLLKLYNDTHHLDDKKLT